MKVIKEYNEFTWDMVRGLPKAYYHKLNNIPFVVNCKPNLSGLYYFCDNIEEVNEFEDINPKETYQYNRPSFTLSEWTPPPLKQMYGGILLCNKPTVIIQNKYTLEWNEGIFNYFPLDTLEKIFNKFIDTHQIIYIRPDGNLNNYYYDKNKLMPFKDYELIKNKYPTVLTIYDVMEQYGLDYNTAQFAAHATSDLHITTSGGNACVSAYFGGVVHIFDAPYPKLYSGRGIWKTDSWLKELSTSKIIGHNTYESLINSL